MNEVPSHDNFFRNILSDIRLAAEYLQSYLPSYISEQLDFSTLKQLSDTYLSDELKKSLSDALFGCGTKWGSKVHVAILIEHKSYIDKYAPIQLGSYLFSAYQKQAKNNEPLSLVIPVLFYHGRQKWQYQTLSGLFPDVPDDWKPFLPNFDFVYNNLNEMNDEQIGSLGNNLLAASFQAMKHVWEKEWLEANALRLFILASEGQEGQKKALIIYIGARSNLTEKVLNSLPEPVKTNVMNTLDVFYERGIEKGIERGIEKGREEGKEEIVRNLIASNQFTLQQISNLAGVPESFVNKVQSSMKSE